jgi:nicotinate phosphoribosyltransferase
MLTQIQIGALKGYEHVNDTALQRWEEVYPNTPTALIALTDTFSTEAFFKVRIHLDAYINLF